MGRAVVEKFRAGGDEGALIAWRVPVELTPVLALAWTRAEKDNTYTKLDLMDESAVEDFFGQNSVDGELNPVRVALQLTSSRCAL